MHGHSSSLKMWARNSSETFGKLHGITSQNVSIFNKVFIVPLIPGILNVFTINNPYFLITMYELLTPQSDGRELPSILAQCAQRSQCPITKTPALRFTDSEPVQSASFEAKHHDSITLPPKHRKQTVYAVSCRNTNKSSAHVFPHVIWVYFSISLVKKGSGKVFFASG